MSKLDYFPQNVLVRRSEQSDLTAVVADFGLAAKIPRASDLHGRLPQVGSPYWMSPECLKGKFYDQRADIFSFGELLLLKFLCCCRILRGIQSRREENAGKKSSLALLFPMFAMHKNGRMDGLYLGICKCMAQRPIRTPACWLLLQGQPSILRERANTISSLIIPVSAAALQRFPSVVVGRPAHFPLSAPFILWLL